MSPRSPPKLSDYGISTKESSRWQKIAMVPEDRFEHFLATTKALTQAAVLRASYSERKAGEILAGMEKNPGAREPGTSRGNIVLPRQPPKLSDMSVTKIESSRWQKTRGNLMRY